MKVYWSTRLLYRSFLVSTTLSRRLSERPEKNTSSAKTRSTGDYSSGPYVRRPRSRIVRSILSLVLDVRGNISPYFHGVAPIERSKPNQFHIVFSQSSQPCSSDHMENTITGLNVSKYVVPISIHRTLLALYTIHVTASGANNRPYVN